MRTHRAIRRARSSRPPWGWSARGELPQTAALLRDVGRAQPASADHLRLFFYASKFGNLFGRHGLGVNAEITNQRVRLTGHPALDTVTRVIIVADEKYMT